MVQAAFGTPETSEDEGALTISLSLGAWEAWLLFAKCDGEGSVAVSFRDHDEVTLLLALKVRYVHLQFTSCPYLT